jgi:hypothetical protein
MGVWSKGTMGAPLGNQNAAKAHKWAAAIERALARKATGAPPPEDVSDFIRGLDKAADEFVSQLFDKKDLGYFKEMGDRMDGKPTQAIDATVKGSLAEVLTGIGSGNNPPLEG